VSRHATRDYDRGDRVGAELLRELTALLRRGVKDPRLGDITLQEVRVSRDLGHAKVFFTCFPVDQDHEAQARLLNGPLAGFLRRELSRSARLRSVPQLHFVHDESILRGEHLAALIEQAVGDGGAARDAPPGRSADGDDDPR
jgi:ribosome-binding factor A